jgi:hypothetical protein
MRHFRATQWKQYSAEFTARVVLEVPSPKLHIDLPRLFPKLSGLPAVLPQPYRLELGPDDCGMDDGRWTSGSPLACEKRQYRSMDSIQSRGLDGA